MDDCSLGEQTATGQLKGELILSKNIFNNMTDRELLVQVVTVQSEMRNDVAEMKAHMKTTNGEVAALRKDFGEKSVTDDIRHARLEGMTATIRWFAVVTSGLVTIAGVISGILISMDRFLG